MLPGEGIGLEEKAAALKSEIATLLGASEEAQTYSGMLHTWLFERDTGRGDQGYSPWPMFTLFACEAVCGEWKHAVSAAAAIEFYVAAADLLDDIEDGDCAFLLERGYTEAQAVNGATGLLMLGQSAITRLTAWQVPAEKVVAVLDALASYSVEACAAQHLEFSNQQSEETSEEDYIRLTGLKSGALGAWACAVGALLATQDGDVVKELAQFGKSVAVAGQIANDIGGLVQPRAGRSDVARKKITLPVLYGLRHADDSDARFLRSLFNSSEEVTPTMEGRATQTLMRVGAVQYALVRAEIEKQAALAALERSGITPQSYASLASFAGLQN